MVLLFYTLTVSRLFGMFMRLVGVVAYVSCIKIFADADHYSIGGCKKELIKSYIRQVVSEIETRVTKQKPSNHHDAATGGSGARERASKRASEQPSNRATEQPTPIHISRHRSSYTHTYSERTV